jgi:hypothetical protein
MDLLSEAEGSFAGFEEAEGNVAVVGLEEGRSRCHLAELFSVSVCVWKIVGWKRVCSNRRYNCLGSRLDSTGQLLQ